MVKYFSKVLIVIEILFEYHRNIARKSLDVFIIGLNSNLCIQVFHCCNSSSVNIAVQKQH
jgi:hypothetical protein